MTILFSFFILTFFNNERSILENSALISNENTQSLVEKVSTDTDTNKVAVISFRNRTYALLRILSVNENGIVTKNGLIKFNMISTIQIDDVQRLDELASYNDETVIDANSQTIYFDHPEQGWFIDSEASVTFNAFSKIPELHFGYKLKPLKSNLFYLTQFALSEESYSSNQFFSFSFAVGFKQTEKVDFYFALRRIEILIRYLGEYGVQLQKAKSRIAPSAGLLFSQPLFVKNLNLNLKAQISLLNEFSEYKDALELLMGFSYRF